MAATQSIRHIPQSSVPAERPIARPYARPQASTPNAPTDSIAWLFVMPITLALLTAFAILFPLR